jgi:thymidylate synthase
MIVNTVRNVNQALAVGLGLMLDDRVALTENTRNGPVISASEPVTTVTLRPDERVLFSPARNANPFFHLMEALWMLAGRNDLKWLAQYNKQMAKYSDDGGDTQPGAYGFRWRKHFGYDQLDEIVDHLKADPKSRRAVLTMWDGWGIHQYPDGTFQMNGDLLSARASADVPCNTQAYFRILEGRLDMTVMCRSNDLWWGAHGANAVHFSILQEYVAARLNLKLGTLTQVSNNYHVYTDVVNNFGAKISDAIDTDFYTRGVTQGLVQPTRIFHFNDMDLFERDLPAFMVHFDPAINPIKTPYERGGQRQMDGLSLDHPFLRDVAVPMARAWDAHKCYDYQTALDRCRKIGGEGGYNTDWHRAAVNWMVRANERRIYASA